MDARVQLDQLLWDFALKRSWQSRAHLTIALSTTDHAKTHGLPASPAPMAPPLNLGQPPANAAVDALLRRHGIRRSLSDPPDPIGPNGTRLTLEYLEFLAGLHQRGLADFALIESWWVARVREQFANTPLTLRRARGQSALAAIAGLITEVRERQESARVKLLDTVLHHMVGAALETASHAGEAPRQASLAGPLSQSTANYQLGDTAFQVTAVPTDALVRKCSANLAAGLRPVIVTPHANVSAMHELIEIAGIAPHVEVRAAERWIPGLHCREKAGALPDATLDWLHFVQSYNRRIEECERDPSLLIQLVGS